MLTPDLLCNRLPVTAVALTRDDKTAFAVSKDGALVKLDIETGTRRATLVLGGSVPPQLWRLACPRRLA